MPNQEPSKGVKRYPKNPKKRDRPKSKADVSEEEASELFQVNGFDEHSSVEVMNWIGDGGNGDPLDISTLAETQRLFILNADEIKAETRNALAAALIAKDPKRQGMEDSDYEDVLNSVTSKLKKLQLDKRKLVLTLIRQRWLELKRDPKNHMTDYG